jgi:hypothetical protein
VGKTKTPVAASLEVKEPIMENVVANTNSGEKGEGEGEMSMEEEEAERAEKICNRVFDKLKQILVQQKVVFEKRGRFTANNSNSGSDNNGSNDKATSSNEGMAATASGDDEQQESRKRLKVELSNGRIDLFAHEGMAGEMHTANNSSSSSAPAVPRKRLPSNKSITLVGTATLHLNVDHKIHQMDLTFSLQE